MIPIYRAKKIDSDEWVDGIGIDGNFLITKTKLLRDEFGHPNKEGVYIAIYNSVDLSTLAIHFPNIIDKNGKKIFASLSEDGVGGDIINSINYEWNLNNKILTFFAPRGFNVKMFGMDGYSLHSVEVIGIHKGES